MSHRSPIALLMLTLQMLFSNQAGAAEKIPTLSPQQRWITVASTQDFDTAIGIAQYYQWTGSRVMKSKNGWFAVVLGPYAATDKAALLKVEPNLTDLPTDVVFSKGNNFVAQMWEENNAADRALLSPYTPERPAHLSLNGLSVEVSMTGDEDNPGPTTIKGNTDTGESFVFATNPDFTISGSDAALLRLDPTTDLPQVVATRFSGGAHCCTMTWLATQPKGAAGWTLIDGANLDGGGYGFADLDGDGALEMRAVDNNFLYTFGSYADSFAPPRIFQLRGSILIDVTTRQQFRVLLKRDLANREFSAKLTPDLWNSNGYLAAWVAVKNLLGEGDEAWDRMEKSYQKDSDFGPQECKSGQKIADCPEDNLKFIPFPKALAAFLNNLDYGQLPDQARKLLD